jgi:hypothetical protein
MDLAHNISEWVMDSWYLYPAPIDLQPENDEYGIEAVIISHLSTLFVQL